MCYKSLLYMSDRCAKLIRLCSVLCHNTWPLLLYYIHCSDHRIYVCVYTYNLNILNTNQFHRHIPATQQHFIIFVILFSFVTVLHLRTHTHISYSFNLSSLKNHIKYIQKFRGDLLNWGFFIAILLLLVESKQKYLCKQISVRQTQEHSLWLVSILTQIIFIYCHFITPSFCKLQSTDRFNNFKVFKSEFHLTSFKWTIAVSQELKCRYFSNSQIWGKSILFWGA